MSNRFVLDSAALASVVKNRSRAEFNKFRSGRNCLTEEFSTGSSYDGPFLVIYKEGTLSVINGLDPTAPEAGYYFINGNFLSAKKKEGIAPANGWLCLTASSVSNSQRDGDFEIVANVTFPQERGTRATFPLASVTQKNGKWVVEQICRWQIPELWTFESCENSGNNGQGGEDTGAVPQ